MNFEIERKIEVNRWIIKARWFYMIGILLIGVLTKTISESNLHFSLKEMLSIVVVFTFFNLLFLLILRRIEKQKNNFGKINNKLIIFLGCSQLIVELATFVLVMHKAGGIESISSIFFFLPIVSASLLFGPAGSISVALASGLLINLLVLTEYFGIITHIPRYNQSTLDFTSLPVALTKTTTSSVFYFIIGIFSGFGSRLLFKREKMLKEQAEKMNSESELRKKELTQLDSTTKLLTTRDKELWEKNLLLDKKINELKSSEQSLIKALRETEKAKFIVEEEKNKTQAIISNFTDPIIVLDKERRITLFNLATKIALGLKSSDLGKTVPDSEGFSLGSFRDFIRKKFDFKKIESEKISGSSKDGNDLLKEELYIKEDDSESTYKVITVRIHDNEGNDMGTMKIFYDITREKIIDQMKSDFISIAAHQLRTPLSAIKWSTGMLLDGDVGPLNIEQENFLRKSYVSNEAMINLVNDLLNVSRIEEGRFGYEFKNLPVQEVIDTVVENVKQQLDKAGIDLKINNPDKKAEACLDKSKMILALQNLLENSIKYTPRYGTIEIIVEKPEKELLTLTIKDSGVGIPQKEQKKIFTKFFRASNVMLMETEGSGLGLFIVKNIVEKHGGSISVTSQEQKGTTVKISLPIECKI